MRYSLSPERYMRRVVATSLKSTGSMWSKLSRTSVTSATPTGLRADEPEKITSSMAWPLSCLALCSPSTHRMASDTLDLPEPLGPTMTVSPGSNVMCARSAKDLNPLRVSDFRYTVPRYPSFFFKMTPFVVYPMRSSASSAAAASASFLDEPVPRPRRTPPTRATAVKVGSWAGPSSPTTL